MKKWGALIFSIIGSLIITNIITVCILSKKNELLEFEYFREGLCIYSDCVYTGDKIHPYSCSICWVIDYETEKVIEVDVYNEIVYCKIESGDTIGYIIDYDYTDADLLYVIKAN